jgi:hypothetical protein
MQYKNKLSHQKHQIKRLKKELRRKKKRKERRAGRLITQKNKFTDYVYVQAPAIFSFLHNTVEVLYFIRQLENCLRSRQKTFVVLNGVIQMHHDAIVVLVSILRRFKDESVQFNGNLPFNEEARQVLIDSEFFLMLYKMLYDSTPKREELYTKPNCSIHTRTDKKVDVALTDKLIREASETVWGKPMRCTGVYRILIELMTNTHNHAEIREKGRERWHICAVHLKEEKKVIFTFVDYGVGVITSLQNKQPGQKMYGFFQKLLHLFSGNATNVAIIREIFLDEKQISSTGETYRGYGLPSLYNSFLEQEIVNFNYITNDVHFNAVKKEFTPLAENFSGTFIYWELNDACDFLNPLP